MPDKIFEQKELDLKEKVERDELTSAEIMEIGKPITISDRIKKILNSEFGILIANQDNKSVRIVPVNSTKIIKLVIYLNSVSKFVTQILKFYQQHKIEIVYTSGICFRKNIEKSEDCIYESYISIENCEGLTDVKIIEEIQKIEGVEKIFIVSLNNSSFN